MSELACAFFAEIIPSVAVYSQIITNIVNFYLDESQREAREDIIRLTSLQSFDARAKVLAYLNQAISSFSAESCALDLT